MKKQIAVALCALALSVPLMAATTLPVKEQQKIDQEAEAAKKAAEKRADFERRKRAYIESMRAMEKKAKEVEKESKSKEVPKK